MNNDNKETDLIATSGERALQGRSASLVKRGLKSLDSLGREAIFPSDASVGDAYLVDEDKLDRWLDKWIYWGRFYSESLGPLGVQEIKNVRGKLRVPAGKALYLVRDKEAHEEQLSKISPECLDGLFFADIPLQDASRIAHLVGLKCLGLVQSNVADESLAAISQLESLSYLLLYRPENITEQGLLNLSKLSQLSHLSLNRAKNLSDDALGFVSKLRRLAYLDLSFTEVTDKGLRYLRELDTLSSLALQGLKISDAGLVTISNLARLKHIDLSHSRVTDDGLAALNGLDLHYLDLSFTPVTNAAFVEIQGHAHLSTLRLSYTAVSDEGLSALSKLDHLSHLDLGETGITDVGLTYLSTFPALSEIVLYGTAITDSGVSQLVKLRSLKSLHLLNTNVSESALRNLRVELPECKIVH